MPELFPITYRSPKEPDRATAILFKNANVFDGKSDTLR